MGGRVTPLVEARGLGKSYVDGPSVVRVLADLDLTVMPGERLAVVGASGVGKSTLLHLLGALDRPTAGQLLFDGVDLATRSENELAAFRNREVGFVFQFHHLLGDFTALENVMLPALIACEPLRAARARASELLERVGLGDRLDHRPGALSGGEQQRVAVARAIVHRPRLDRRHAQPRARRGARPHALPGGRPAQGGRARSIRRVARDAQRRGAVSPGMRRAAGVLAVLLLAAPQPAAQAQGEPSVGQVRITGNLRVEEDAIRVHLRTQPGAPFDKDTLDRDIRSIYGMGFFDQVDADVTPAEGHHVDVTFRVKERPLVRNVKVDGVTKLKKEEVEGALRVRPHTILDPEKAKQGIEAAKKLYAEKGYLDADIRYRTE